MSDMLDTQRAASVAGGPCGCERSVDARIREAQDLLFFAYRDFTNAADVVLEELGLGRAHHRALHFIGRNPGITVSDLLAILRITKQALARVLNTLMEERYVAQAPGAADRRQRLLTLTVKGAALERRLFQRQRDRLAPALTQADPAVAAGFRAALRGIMDDSAREYLDAAYPDAAGIAPPGTVPPGTVPPGTVPPGGNTCTAKIRSMTGPEADNGDG